MGKVRPWKSQVRPWRPTRPSASGAGGAELGAVVRFQVTAVPLVCPGEPISSEHFHRAVSVNDEDLLVRILQEG